MTPTEITRSDVTAVAERELDLAIIPIVVVADGLLYGSLEMNLRAVSPTA